MAEEIKKPFINLSDVDDVRILIKVKGKHYSIVAKEDAEECKELRIAMLGVILDSHFVVDTPLEDLKNLQPL